jgi:hypothetical protein
MISPLLLRSSRWVSFFVITVIVAPVLQSIFVFQEGLNQARRQATGGAGRQDAEQRAARRNPGKLALQDPRAQPPGDQIADRESGESAILAEVGAEHRPSAPDTGVCQRFLKP